MAGRFEATVVGSDPAIDVALVRIPKAPNLPEAPLGNSDELRAGEWVCAIGNPLGYVHSVTVGVVSFIGRKLFDQSLDDYIQTDAAINFGNSGGPLINSRGRGRRHQLGDQLQGLEHRVRPADQPGGRCPAAAEGDRPGLARVHRRHAHRRDARAAASARPDGGRGAMVQDVTPRSPAERAGLRAYDVIVEVEGRRVASNQELIQSISARQPGTVAELDVLREGRRHTMTSSWPSGPHGVRSPVPRRRRLVRRSRRHGCSTPRCRWG